MAVAMQCHQPGGLRWSEDDSVKDEGLRLPLAWGVWGQTVSAWEKWPHISPFSQASPKRRCVVGGWWRHQHWGGQVPVLTPQWYVRGGVRPPFWELTKPFSGKCPRQRASAMACSVTQIYGWTADPSSNAAVRAVHYNMGLNLCVPLSY